MGAFGMIIGAIRGIEVVMGGLWGGRARRPTVLGTIRERSCAGVGGVLNVQARDLQVRLEDRRKGNVEIIGNKRSDARLSV